MIQATDILDIGFCLVIILLNAIGMNKDTTAQKV
jgi:hypothetical protein